MSTCWHKTCQIGGLKWIYRW